MSRDSQQSWRERHPFLYGLSQTFGIAPIRRPVETVEESFQRVADAIREAAAAVEGRDQ